MATAFVSFRGGTPATVTLVLRVWACLTSYSHVSGPAEILVWARAG
jgi:hypothetical protein